MMMLRPPPKYTVSQWADKNRYLSSEASAEAGKWNTSRAEFQREIMDSFTDPSVERIVVMSASQIGKTELLLNIIGFHIDIDPSPILMIQPTLQMAGTFSKNRISPMLRDTASLTHKVLPARSRDSNNTIYAKSFTGGSLDLVGSNSAASVSSRPIRILLCDEIDRYSVLGTTEGDIIALGTRRTSNFYNRKVALVSTPTTKGSSKIENAYLQGDQRKFIVPCHDCEHESELEWKNVKWNEGEPEKAVYVCSECGSAWDDSKRLANIKRGYWKANSKFTGTASFHLNGLYSSWSTMGEIATHFLQAKNLPETLRVFVNTVLAESWDENEGEKVEEYQLRKRAYNWGKDLPEDVVLLVAGVDVQDDRLEITITGFCRDEQVYIIDHKIIFGDPSTPQLWDELTEILEEKYIHPKGIELSIKCACIDSGGHFTQQTYDYTKKKVDRRYFAIKGVGGEGRPMVGRPSRNNTGKVRLYPVGSDTIKNHVYGRLKITEEGSGYIHLPDHLDEEYFRQLASESRTEKVVRGVRRSQWVKKRARNEAWDCLCYAFAAYNILNVNLRILHEKLNRATEKTKEEKPKKPNPFIRRGGNWMDI